MDKVIIDDSILTDEEPSAIQTDESPRPKNGRDGKDGRNGVDGKNGKDGADGKDGKDSKDGERGETGQSGRDGKQGIAGRDGDRGETGAKGENGNDGNDGKDGTEWHLFATQVDEKKGVEGDFALVQSTSAYYRKEINTYGHLIWKFKGNLKGKDGERGERGFNGSSGGSTVTPGPSPSGGYLHSQPSASATWIVNHNLGFNPIVAVYSVGGREVTAEIIHISVNQLNIIFAAPFSGYARAN